jgi:hypothetical protein
VILISCQSSRARSNSIFSTMATYTLALSSCCSPHAITAPSSVPSLLRFRALPCGSFQPFRLCIQLHDSCSEAIGWIPSHTAPPSRRVVLFTCSSQASPVHMSECPSLYLSVLESCLITTRDHPPRSGAPCSHLRGNEWRACVRLFMRLQRACVHGLMRHRIRTQESPKIIDVAFPIRRQLFRTAREVFTQTVRPSVHPSICGSFHHELHTPNLRHALQPAVTAGIEYVPIGCRPLNGIKI